MVELHELQACFAELRHEGERLAGRLGDLPQRAATYHHLYEDSGGNFVFPLIAAHGALWAGRYFAFGAKLGRCCAWQYPFSRQRRIDALEQLARFADAFRGINRSVCVEAYAAYHFTAVWGEHPQADQLVPSSLLAELRRCHAAKRQGTDLCDADKRSMFAAFFRYEQEKIVGPAIDQAVAEFDWPLMKHLALKPTIRFAYFPKGHGLRFRNFADQSERVTNGLAAFDMAASVGWKPVEAALRAYDTLPPAFFVNSAEHFAGVRQAVLTAS